ncbi:MAG: hypothetical protein V3T76_06950, partial [candidate division NC10 bacterium]
MAEYDQDYPPINNTQHLHSYVTTTDQPRYATRSQCKKYNIQVPDLFKTASRKQSTPSKGNQQEKTPSAQTIHTTPPKTPLIMTDPSIPLLHKDPRTRKHHRNSRNKTSPINHPPITYISDPPATCAQDSDSPSDTETQLPTKSDIYRNSTNGQQRSTTHPTPDTYKNTQGRQKSQRKRKQPDRFQTPIPPPPKQKEPKKQHTVPVQTPSSSDTDEESRNIPVKEKIINKVYTSHAIDEPTQNIFTPQSQEDKQPYHFASLAPTEIQSPPTVTEEVTQPTLPTHFPQSKPLMTQPQAVTEIKYVSQVPRQKEINRFLDILNTKCLNQYTLPLTLQELRKQQKADPYYTDFINYLQLDMLPSNKALHANIIAQSQSYIMFNGLLFRASPFTTTNPKLALCIPEKLAFTLFDQYHVSLLSSHVGLTKSFYRIREDYYIRNLYNLLYKYIHSCRLCSSRRHIKVNEKQRDYAERIIQDYSPFHTIAIDIKIMPQSSKGYTYLLIARCQLTRYVVSAALPKRDAVSVCEALYQKIFTVFGPCKVIIADMDSAFKNQLVNAIFTTLGIKITFVSKENHQSNTAERSISAISSLLVHYITKYSNQWPIFHNSACFTYNTFEIKHLGFSPYQMMFNRTPPQITNYDFTIQNPNTYDYQTYAELMTHRFNAMSKMVIERHNTKIQDKNLQRNRTLTKIKEFNEGDCVYLLFPERTALPPSQIQSKSICLSYVGPLFIHEKIADTQYMLKTCNNEVITQIYHIARLKKGSARTMDNKVVTTYEDFILG